MEQDINERVAVLEAEVENIKESQAKNQSEHQLILTELSTINKTISKYQSFVGGIIFILGAIWAFIDFAKGWLINHIK